MPRNRRTASIPQRVYALRMTSVSHDERNDSPKASRSRRISRKL